MSCARMKSPREIVILREATRIAGLGIIEAMRDARPGMREYELQADAEYVFKKNGAYGPAYFALIATGENTWYSHYHKNTRALDAGDLVQFDYAPDYQVLLERRDACLSRRRQVHAAPARVLHHLPAALPGADDLDRGPRPRPPTSSRRRWSRWTP